MISTVNMALAAFVAIVAALLVAVLVPCVISELWLRRRARHDYRVAPGIQHLKQPEDPLAKVEHEIQFKRKQMRGTEHQLRDLEGEA